jgi:hypothetical protein
VPDTTCHMSISLDGLVAGPDQSREDPLGKGAGGRTTTNPGETTGGLW